MNQTENETQSKSFARFIFDTLVTVAIAVALALFIARFVAQVTIVQGSSMEPTLQSTQRVIANKLVYRFGEPERGDIVLVQLPDMTEPLIKRVIGEPGETIAVTYSETMIDDIVIEEPYLDPTRPQTDFSAVTIPSDRWFVMGDNRNNSRDSRSFNTVTKEMIVGKARVSIWPPSEIGIVK